MKTLLALVVAPLALAAPASAQLFHRHPAPAPKHHGFLHRAAVGVGARKVLMPHYTVLGTVRDASRTATRVQPASAMVLADRWSQDGVRDVQIACPAGVRYDRAAFRQTFLGVKRARSHRRPVGSGA